MAPPGQSSSSSFAGLPLAAKLLFLILLMGMVGAAYYFPLHMPLMSDIDQAEQKYGKLEKDLQKAKEKQQEYLRLTQELANREAIDRRNKRVLPEQAEIAGFLQDINRLAELSGLGMKLVEPRPEQREQLYVKIPVNLQVSGRYHQLMKFFYNVSELERAVSMENITLSNPHLEEEDVVLDVNVMATTYRRPTAAEGGKGKGGKGKGGKGKGKGGKGKGGKGGGKR